MPSSNQPERAQTGSAANPPRPATVALHHVGCRLNQAEIEALADNLGRRGYTVVPFSAPADVYVVNTCTVTGAGDADSRRAVRRALRLNPNATVVATGCYAQRRPDELRQVGVHLVVGNGDKVSLVEHLDAHLRGRPLAPPAASTAPHTSAFLRIAGAVPQGRTRGSLQVQDGCDEHCTYCIIPAVRGQSVSRPAEEIVAQARDMVVAGYREITLTGVNTGSYGRDRGETDGLARLLASLLTIDGLGRLRLGSVEPGELTDRLIDLVAGSPRICRHFHVPMQSGDDDVLRRMGRRYRRDGYARRIQRLAAAVPDGAIGADVMVAFPGETVEAFANTEALVRDLPMAYLHVFPYSPRAGTPAARLPERHPPAEARARAQRLIELGNTKRLAFHERFVGSRLVALIEDHKDEATGMAVGISDNYIRVLVPPHSSSPNQFMAIHVTRAAAGLVHGEPIL